MKKKSNKRIKKYYVPDSYKIYCTCTILTKHHMLCIIVTNGSANFNVPDSDTLFDPFHYNDIYYYPSVQLIKHRNYIDYSYYIYDIKVQFRESTTELTDEIVNKICEEVFGLKHLIKLKGSDDYEY